MDLFSGIKWIRFQLTKTLSVIDQVNRRQEKDANVTGRYGVWVLDLGGGGKNGRRLGAKSAPGGRNGWKDGDSC